ncbi:MAG TPA: zf-HC2 domain-containing protein [Noviherbaspirillum sp.]|uniref:zf-HC2 domain-containing protein n=1 Tax=Noviherbaspirillum sp. TaxID=1926288 RepID=UPI002D5A1343|nr:zf-HC2 domain-containing protein [Noviherbaspirillum sp.]HYD94591.1 zf-HC2 domain-containing protein [Noviherbaspirillum sp.]
MPLKPTCKEIHRLTSEGMDRELSLVERARVRMHLLACNACRTFTSQMDLLRTAMRQLGGDETDPGPK